MATEIPAIPDLLVLVFDILGETVGSSAPDDIVLPNLVVNGSVWFFSPSTLFTQSIMTIPSGSWISGEDSEEKTLTKGYLSLKNPQGIHE